MFECFRCYIERLLRRISKRFLGELDLIGAKRRAVCFGCVVLVRTAESDMRADDDERWTIADFLCSDDRLVESVEIICIFDALHMPVVCFEPLRGIVAEGEAGVSFDGDVVVVVETDDLAELLMACVR